MYNHILLVFLTSFRANILSFFTQDLQLVQEDISESLRVAFSDCSRIEKDNVIIIIIIIMIIMIIMITMIIMIMIIVIT